jgi:hypothetical protein
MKKDNIVKFNAKAKHAAAVWCFENDAEGKIIAEKFGVFEINFGLDYNIFAKEDELDLVSEDGYVSRLPLSVAATAPTPDVDDTGS